MSSAGKRTRDGVEVVKDDMAFFWQCQSPGTTGQLKGCGFFKILDMRGEGRGPCIGYGDEGVEAEVEADESDERPGEAKAVPSSGGEDTAPVIETTAADP
jgi:hypothetical protein